MAFYPASELVLNPNGSVYHLNLLPHEVAPIVITVGDPDRVEMVSQHFDTILYKKQHREFITHTGSFNGKLITVISTGIGCDNIDIVLNELDALVNIDFETRMVKPQLTSLKIIRIGTSGALIPDIPVESFVVSQGAIGYDGLMHFYPYQPTPQAQQIYNALPNLGNNITPYVAMASPELVNLFDFQHPQWFSGVTITCSGFYAPQGRALRAGALLPHFLDDLRSIKLPTSYQLANFEMETAAIYGLAQLLGHSAASVNVILANRSSRQFSANPKKAVKALIEQALPIIANNL